MAPLRCQLLMTGNELMTGVTVDSNSAFIAEQLHDIGISVSKKVTVGDCLVDLEREISDACNNNQLLLINGGLGPTDDDLTARALARVCEQPLVNHADAEQHVRQWCTKRGITANNANLKQALLPRDAQIIPNSAGSAVGIRLKHKQCLILCTPGVPTEMRLMLQQEITPFLRKKFPDCRQQFIKRLQVFGMGESSIQQKVHNEIPDWPPEVELGFRAGMPTLEVKLTVREKNQIPLRDQYEHRLRALLGAQIFGEDNETLPSIVIDLLKKQQKKMVTAESCTGGLIASMITSIAGSSKVFEAGFITYSNEIKHRVLNVNTQTLLDQGAVSEAVVLQMAHGALEKTDADYVISVSGIAGPDGGTEEKPVGTVWLAWGEKEKMKTHKLFYPAERKYFQLIVAAYALDLIRRELLCITERPRYLK